MLLLLRAVQIACIVILVAVLFGFREVFHASADFFGSGFAAGFLVGALFMMALYVFICWVDPTSRPRGTTSKHDGFRNRFD